MPSPTVPQPEPSATDHEPGERLQPSLADVASQARPDPDGQVDPSQPEPPPEIDPQARVDPADPQLPPEIDPQARIDPAEPEPPPEIDPQARVDPADPAELAEPEPPPEIDPELLARRREALRYVRKLGDPVLRARAVPVEHFDDQLRQQVERMGVLMEDAMGVGLAATQLGVLQRLLVYRVQHESRVIALVNPEIEWSGDDLETMEEGCLSLPGVLVDVERPIHLRVSARDEYGEPILVEASGLEARVIAHEVDHLDGVLILDRTSREQRREAMRAMREAAAAGTEPS